MQGVHSPMMRVPVVMRLQVDAGTRLSIGPRGVVHLPDGLVRCPAFPQLEGVAYITRLTGAPVVFKFRGCAVVVAGLNAVHAEPLGVWELGRGGRFGTPLVPACASASSVSRCSRCPISDGRFPDSLKPKVHSHCEEWYVINVSYPSAPATPLNAARSPSIKPCAIASQTGP